MNFYETVDMSYPNLRIFLKKFGVEIEAPDELIPYDIGDRMYCDATYSVSGRILRHGVKPIRIDGLEVVPQVSEEVALYCHSPEPYFVLRLGTMALPWILGNNATLS